MVIRGQHKVLKPLFILGSKSFSGTMVLYSQGTHLGWFCMVVDDTDMVKRGRNGWEKNAVRCVWGYMCNQDALLPCQAAANSQWVHPSTCVCLLDRDPLYTTLLKLYLPTEATFPARSLPTSPFVFSSYLSYSVTVSNQQVGAKS